MIDLIPFATAVLRTGDVFDLGGLPSGHRIVGEVTEARIEGERLAAHMVGSAADWAAMRPDGTVDVDVRMTLETDDGVRLSLTYQGNMDFERSAQPIISLMRFECAHEQYAWLNRMRTAAKGELVDGEIRYEIFELR